MTAKKRILRLLLHQCKKFTTKEKVRASLPHFENSCR